MCECPVCGMEAEVQSTDPVSRYLIVSCRTCTGPEFETRRFNIERSAINKVKDNKTAYKVSAYIRRMTPKLEKNEYLYIHIDRNIGKSGPGEPYLATVDEIIADFPGTIMERMTRALENLAMMTGYFGQRIQITVKHDYPLLYCISPEEVYAMVKALTERGWIENEPLSGQGISEQTCQQRGVKTQVNGWSVTVTADGLARVEQKLAGADSIEVFVAIPFTDATETTYEQGIRRGIEEAGYRAFRVKDREHNNWITDEIIAGIRKSCFVVCDFTGNNPGVYYEAGFARGLGKETIHLCRKDKMDDLHFDVKQVNTINYENVEELAERLKYRIEACFPKTTK